MFKPIAHSYHRRSYLQTFLHSLDLELKNAVTNISHDLRTPLTAIYGYLDLLEQEEKSETVNRYIAVIRNRTKMLKQLMQFKYSGKSIPSSGVGILLSYKS